MFSPNIHFQFLTRMLLQVILIIVSVELIRKGLGRFDLHRRRARTRASNRLDHIQIRVDYSRRNGDR